MIDNAIRAEGVTKSYGTRRALVDFSAEIAHGTCTGLIGPNGAGKSTLNRLLYGRTKRDGGNLEVLGMDTSRYANGLRAKIGVVTQDNYLDADLSVKDNLMVFGIYQGMSSREARERALRALEQFSLSSRGSDPVNSLSGGMQRRLALARALMHDPEIILLDEPTTGLDPVARQELWMTLLALKAEGRTLLLATHYLDEAERLCDDIILMNHGSIIGRGSSAELIQRNTESNQDEARLNNTSGSPATLEDLYLTLFERSTDD